jgi:predicted Fe-Mo cluster-binding NifX family protein
MKIAVSAAGPSLEDAIDPRFGRCKVFLIIDPATLDFTVVDNAGRNLSGGAGIEAAQRVADQGVTRVLTGRCGPNAEKVLAAAGIDIVDGCSGPVREAVERFRSAPQDPAPPVRAGRASSEPTPPPASSDRAGTDGCGSRAGQGSGRGMGKGRGMGRRCGMGGGSTPLRRPAAPAALSSSPDDVESLKAEVEQLRRRLRDTQDRIRRLES